jgi:RNA polymerase-binding transcription factor DksA
MGGNPELTPAVLAELRSALLRRQAELQRQIADLRRDMRGPVDRLEDVEDAATIDPSDTGDASAELQDRGVTNALLLDLQAQRDEVEHALTKFDTGTYGICERCGRPIPLARLRVLPEARYDVEYEEDVEAGRAPR